MLGNISKKILIDELTTEIRILAEEKKKTVRIVEKTRNINLARAQETIDIVTANIESAVTELNALKSEL
jgi:hypothetical protein